MKHFLTYLLLLGSLSAARAQWTFERPRWEFDVETGVAFSGYNDVRIPNEGGTLFSLSRDLDIRPTAFLRLRAWRTFGGRHGVGVLAAPLRFRAEGTFAQPVIFEGHSFGTGTVNALYRFDSYRLTYRYGLVLNPRFRLDVGATAKIRSAEVTLEDERSDTSNTDLGFVPLLYVRAEWRPAERFGLVLEADALASPQGRAEDVLLAACLYPNETITLRAGYRFVEGGADVDQVYNFTWIHFATVGAFFHF